MAAGTYVGLCEREFWKTTPAYLRAMLKAKRASEREIWEVVRSHSYAVSALHLPKRIAPRSFWPLPWDTEKARKVTDVDGAVLERFMQKLNAANGPK